MEKSDKFELDGCKIRYHLDRLAEWRYGDKKKVFPVYVEISPVGYCNHRCSFCAVDYLGYKHLALSTNVLKRTVVDMALHGVRSVMYAGEGEPLLHPDIAEIVEWTKRNGIDVAITTNGIALTENFCDIALASCTWVKVSVDAGTEGVYEKIHRGNKGDWDKLWKNIAYAVSLQTGAVIGVQCVLLPENARTLDTLARKCKETGVDYLVVKPYSQHSKSGNTLHANIKYKDMYVDYLEPLGIYDSDSFKVIVRQSAMSSWDEEDRKHDYETCLSVPFFWAYVMATGDVYGCSAYLEDKRFCYGNVNEALFSEVWLGSRREEAIEMMSKFEIDECRINCRMHPTNKWLWEVTRDVEHKNFI